MLLSPNCVAISEFEACFARYDLMSEMGENEWWNLDERKKRDHLY